MTFEYYSRTFRGKAADVGYSEENIVKCLDYAKILIENNIPIIYNLTHLSRHVGFKKNYIIQAAVVSKYSNAYYRFYTVRKKNGKGTRKIMEPLPNLKSIQYWILENILEKVKPSPYAKAYVKKRGLNHNLKFHVNQKKVFSLDIKDFFPSIRFPEVEALFSNLGYSDFISKYLAKLCCLEESLPQGAPTSPYISNLILKNLDMEIANYCKANNIRFTRYADDLTFSGDFNVDNLKTFVEELFNTKGFELNDSKTKLMLRNNRQIVTGIIVNDKPQLDKKTRKMIRQHMYYIINYGLESHMEKLKVNRSFYLKNLIGKISFGIYLNPDDENLKKYHEILTSNYKN